MTKISLTILCCLVTLQMRAQVDSTAVGKMDSTAVSKADSTSVQRDSITWDKELGEVTVVAQRQLIKQEIDRI